MKRNKNRNLALTRSNPARLRSPVIRREAPAPIRNPRAAHYQLQRGHGFWSVTFAGHSAVLKHEKGLDYVAWLLAHPNHAPIHALDLVTRLAALEMPMADLPDPHTGRAVMLENGARVQERDPRLDVAIEMRETIRQQHRLEDLLEHPDTSEPVKAEAERELLALYAFEKRNSARVRNTAAKASDAVARAINRLVRRLASTTDSAGAPLETLRSFGQHLYSYILVPSGRSGRRTFSNTSGFPGCLQYTPPRGIVWDL